ncbi:MAG TPA: ABC transporter ATP-binding protein [Anaerolineae bacterium]|nr:ABC transporter ATP-binding protein [Anaerolineae bacterium]
MTDGRATLLDVENLHIVAQGNGTPRTIVNRLDLCVRRGETVGIVGESGSGKSLSARAIIKLLPPGVSATGKVYFGDIDLLQATERQVQGLRGRHISMVFQDPFTTLNPLKRCGEHITEMLLPVNGVPSSARRAEMLRRLAEVGISEPEAAERYPFQLSGGMRQRVALAASLAKDPELLIADEPSSALDVTTEAEVLKLIRSIQKARGMGMIFITHNLTTAFAVCDRIYVLYAGSLVETGPSKSLLEEPLHPYSLGLLLSDPPVDRRLAKLPTIEGSVPRADQVRDQCPFAPRCRWRAPECVAGAPPLVNLEGERWSACIRVREIRAEMARLAAQARRDEKSIEQPVNSQCILEVTHLSKTFHLRSHDVHAVKDVSFQIGENESVGLVGESGSGKTTIGRCLVGLEQADGGTIRISGIDASDYNRLSTEERQRLRRTIQIVFQDPYSSLDPWQTIGSCLSEALALVDMPPSERKQQVESLLKRVGLPPEYANRRPLALSGGERQRVAIARALAVRPRVLVCDEPVSALDVSVQAQVLELFRQLHAELGLSYLFITHDLAVVRQMADRVYVMYKGEFVEQGPVAAVLDHPQHPYTQRLIASLEEYRNW